MAGLTDVVAVASGALHNLALRRDGTVWAWGWNGVGQLGDGTTTDHAVATQVPGLAGVTLIGTGAHHSFAVSTNGWVYAWGWNAVGQLGTNWGGDFHSPTIITIGPNSSYPPVRQIVGGVYHSLALMADGTVYSWGWNGMGMLGDGRPSPTTAPQPSPVCWGHFHHRRPPPQRGRLCRRLPQGVGVERRRPAGRRHHPRPFLPVPVAPSRGRARRRPGLRRRRPVVTGSKTNG